MNQEKNEPIVPSKVDSENAKRESGPPPVIEPETKPDTRTPEKPRFKRPQDSFFARKKSSRSNENGKKTKDKTEKKPLDPAFRKFVILACVLLGAVLFLCGLIIDQLAFSGGMKNAVLARLGLADVSETPIPPATENKNDPPKSEPLDPGMSMEEFLAQNKPKTPDEPVISEPPKKPESEREELVVVLSEEELALENERQAFLAEEERLFAEKEATEKERIEEEERQKEVERRKRAVIVSAQIKDGLRTLPRVIAFNIPRLSPFGAIEQQPLSGQIFPEFAPFFAALEETELEFVPYYEDPRWKHVLTRDARTSLSRGWTLQAKNEDTTLNLARFNLRAEGLSVQWNPTVLDASNLDACNKLAFASLAIKIDFEGTLYRSEVRLLPNIEASAIKYKQEMNNQVNPVLKRDNFFAIPQWSSAFAGIDLEKQLALELDVIPLNEKIDLVIGGGNDRRFIEFKVRETPDADPIVFTIIAKLNKNSLVFEDQSFEQIISLQKKRSAILKTIRENNDSDSDLQTELSKLETLIKRTNTAKTILKNADLSIHYRVYLNAPDYDKLQKPDARILLISTGL